MIRIGVLGCGYFGAEFARAIKEREDVQLAAVYSPGKSSERLSRELGCLWASSVDEIMENADIDAVIAARPDVFNHNLETVPRLYPTIRPGARYFRSLRLLQRVKDVDPSIFTKSGLMVGLGETKEEIAQVMDDMRAADIDFITIGQYLQPTAKHAPVMHFWTPEEFEGLEKMARAKGFLMVSATPLTRSSYHAGDDFARLRKAREEKLTRLAAE